MDTIATRTLDPALLRLAGRLLLRALSLVACVAAWQWAAAHHLDLGLVTFQNVPSPKDVLDAATALLESPKLALHLKASVWRVFAGFVAAGVAGILLGLVIGRSRRLEDVLLPPLEVLRPIPAVAWIPLAILMFPSSELSMVFITFIGALFPILLNTIHGVEGADPRLVASSRSLGAGLKLLARDAWFVVAADGRDVSAYLLKADAQTQAAKVKGKVVDFDTLKAGKPI